MNTSEEKESLITKKVKNQGFHMTSHRSLAYSKLSASELQISILQRLTYSLIQKEPVE